MQTPFIWYNQNFCVLKALELTFNNQGLPWINYHKMNQSWMHNNNTVCVFVSHQVPKIFRLVEWIGYIGHIDSSKCTGKIRHKCLTTCSWFHLSRSHFSIWFCIHQLINFDSSIYLQFVDAIYRHVSMLVHVTHLPLMSMVISVIVYHHIQEPIVNQVSDHMMHHVSGHMVHVLIWICFVEECQSVCDILTFCI